MPNSNAFTLDEINQILEQLNAHPGARLQYIGSRYVPIFGRKGEDSIEWDNTGTYEPLTIVLYQGNSYTSRQFVPVGVEITNEEYWANTGNYNAQIEQYRQEVAQVSGNVDTINTTLITVNNKIAKIDNSSMFSVEYYGAVGDGETDDSAAFQASANNGYIALTSGKTYVIEKAITGNIKVFKGNGATVLNKSGKEGADIPYIFVINADTCMIDNVNFNSLEQSRGSVIFTGNELNVTNCTFTGYSKEFGYYKTDSQILCASFNNANVNNCTFYDNGNEYGTETESLNRCITFDTVPSDVKGNAHVTNCTFNTVNQAIVNTCPTIAINNCTFINTSDNAIYDFSDTTLISNCDFIDITDEAIVTEKDTQISNCNFSDITNRCIGINAAMGMLSIMGCYFINNSNARITVINTRDTSYVINNLIIDSNVINEGPNGTLNYILNIGSADLLKFTNNIVIGSSESTGSSYILTAINVTAAFIIGNYINNTGSNNLQLSIVYSDSAISAIIDNNFFSSNVRINIPSKQEIISNSKLYKQNGVSSFMSAQVASIISTNAAPENINFANGTLCVDIESGNLYVRNNNSWKQLNS